jgi:hypothetical protein
MSPIPTIIPSSSGTALHVLLTSDLRLEVRRHRRYDYAHSILAEDASRS